MGSFNDWLENAVLDHVFGRKTTDLSTGKWPNLYLGLYSGAITDAHTGTSTGECAGSTYSRTTIANSSAQFRLSTAGSVQSKPVWTITTSAGSDWGTITGMALLNSTSTASGASPKMFAYTTLTGGSVVINSGDTVQVSSGQFVITLA